MSHQKCKFALCVGMFAFGSIAVAQTAPPSSTRPEPPSAATVPSSTTRVEPKSASTRDSSARSLRAEPVPPQVDAAFKTFDTDRNGALSLAEFRAGWQAMRRGGAQTAQARLQHQFEELDANNNGGIDRTEYPNMVLVKRAGSAAPPFSEFDRDGSQKLEYAEYTALVQRLGGSRAGAASPTK